MHAQQFCTILSYLLNRHVSSGDCMFTRWHDGLSGVVLEESTCSGGYMPCSSAQQGMIPERLMALKLIAHVSSAVIESISVRYGVSRIRERN